MMHKIKGNQNVYKEVQEVREITDIDEVARLLNSGGWIALATTSPKTPCMFVMGRVLDTQLPTDSPKE